MRDLALAVIGDPHGEWSCLGRVVQRLHGVALDGVLVVGDFFGEMHLADSYSATARAANGAHLQRTLEMVGNLGVPVLWVPGNHDTRELAGDGNVDGHVAEIAGARVGGIGGAGPNRFGFPYEWDEDEIRALELAPCDILLSHTPPVDTPLDETNWGGRHAGSHAIRERAQGHDGVLVCGHIHEAAGAVQLEGCLCLNAGALGQPFGEAQVGFVWRDSGAWSVGHEVLGGELRRWERT
jgi:Icc-related predicted phosphoesterase